MEGESFINQTGIVIMAVAGGVMREVSRSRLTGHGTLNYAARQPGIDFKLCSTLPRCSIIELRLCGDRHLKSAGGLKSSYELSRQSSLIVLLFYFVTLFKLFSTNSKERRRQNNSVQNFLSRLCL